MTGPPIATFARLGADVHLTEMRSLPVPEWDAMATELLTLRARLAYIASHGGAWEKLVTQGHHDAAALGHVPPSTQTEKAEEGGDVSMTSPLRLARLARILGREIAAGFRDHDAAMQDAGDQALAAADPIARAATALLALTQPLALALAQEPRAAGSAKAAWLDAAKDYIGACRSAIESGDDTSGSSQP